MAKLIGRLQKVGIGKETTKGTAVAPTFWLPVESQNLNSAVTLKKKEGSFGRIEGSYDTDKVEEHSEPELAGIVTDKAIGLLLLAAFGQVNSAVKGGETVVYEHTYSVKNDNDHPALTVALKDGNLDKAVPYGMLEKLGLDVVVGDYIKFSAVFKGKAAAAATQTPVYVAENIFISKHGELKIADTISGLPGASALEVISVKLAIEKNLELLYKLGSIEPSEILNKEFKISGSLEVAMKDTTWFDLFKANTQKAMRLTLTNSDVTIGTSSNPKLEITLAKVSFNPYKMAGGLGDVVTETVDFEGHYSLADTKSIEAVLTNLNVSY